MVSSQDWVQSCTALSTTDCSIMLEDTVVKQKQQINTITKKAQIFAIRQRVGYYCKLTTKNVLLNFDHRLLVRLKHWYLVDILSFLLDIVGGGRCCFTHMAVFPQHPRPFRWHYPLQRDWQPPALPLGTCWLHWNYQSKDIHFKIWVWWWLKRRNNVNFREIVMHASLIRLKCHLTLMIPASRQEEISNDRVQFITTFQVKRHQNDRNFVPLKPTFPQRHETYGRSISPRILKPAETFVFILRVTSMIVPARLKTWR